MADPLSVAASIVGVAVPALHGTRLLLDDLQKIVDAPQSVESLKEDLLSVEMAIKSLQAIGDSEWKSLGGTVADEAKIAISNCKRACDKFRADLQHWTRHSGEGQLSWQDRANVGFFKQRRIKSTSEQLQTCKLTLNSVVSIATLYVYVRCPTQWGCSLLRCRYSSLHHTQITEEVKKTISTKQAEISRAISATDRQVAEVESTLRELDLTAANPERVQNTEDKDNAIEQIEVERAGLDSSQKLLQQLLSMTAEEAITKAASKAQAGSTTVTFGNQNSGVQIGVSHAPISGIYFGGKGS